MIAAIDLLHAATAAGAEFAISGDRLTVSAPRPLPRNLVEQLRREKPVLIQLLSAGSDHPDRTDPATVSSWWACFFYERCDFRELRGRRSPAEAALLAFGDCVVKWHRQHRTQRDTNQCAACGEPFTTVDTFDIDPGVLVHFQLNCIERYGAAARVRAVEGLGEFGIEPPVGFEL